MFKIFNYKTHLRSRVLIFETLINFASDLIIQKIPFLEFKFANLYQNNKKNLSDTVLWQDSRSFPYFQQGFPHIAQEI
jgi:hypothetical protein